MFEVTFFDHRKSEIDEEEPLARNVSPFTVEPGKFTYRLVRAELPLRSTQRSMRTVGLDMDRSPLFRSPFATSGIESSLRIPAAQAREGTVASVSTLSSLTPEQDQLAVSVIRGIAMDGPLAQIVAIGEPLWPSHHLPTCCTAVMRYDPADPNWVDRDRFILSAGHVDLAIRHAPPQRHLAVGR